MIKTAFTSDMSSAPAQVQRAVFNHTSYAELQQYTAAMPTLLVFIDDVIVNDITIEAGTTLQLCYTPGTAFAFTGLVFTDSQWHGLMATCRDDETWTLSCTVL